MGLLAWWRGLTPPPYVVPKLPGRFNWSAPQGGGLVSYQIRAAVNERLATPEAKPATGNADPRASILAPLVDIDIEDETLIYGSTSFLIYDRASDSFRGEFSPPRGATIYRLRCPADAATQQRLLRGTQLIWRGEDYDPTEGLGGELFEILSGPLAGSFALLGTGGRFGASSWAVGAALRPIEDPAFADAGGDEELLALMQRVAIENGAPGVSN